MEEVEEREEGGKKGEGGRQARCVLVRMLIIANMSPCIHTGKDHTTLRKCLQLLSLKFKSTNK